MWLVRAERECGLKQDPIDRRQSATRHVPLVRRVELRELAGEELEIPRDCARVRAVELRVFEEIESRAEKTSPGNLIACESIAPGEVSGRTGKYDLTPRRNDGFNVIGVALLHQLGLSDEGFVDPLLQRPPAIRDIGRDDALTSVHRVDVVHTSVERLFALAGQAGE